MKSLIVNTFEYKPLIESWMKGNRFPISSLNMWSDTTLVVFTDDNKPIYMINIYKTNSPMCWLGCELVNPESTKEQRKGGLEFLISEAEKFCMFNGYRIAFTTSSNPFIIKSLNNREFIEGDKNVSHFIKHL